MRVILAAAAALAALTVSGCDINTGPPKPAAVACNCTAPAAPPAGMRGGEDTAPTPVAPYRYHGHRHAHGTGSWRGHSYYWRREYAETSVATYDYHSSSTSYYMSGGGGGSSGGASAYAYAATGGGVYAGAGAHGGGAYVGDAVHGGDGYHTVERGWVDGHGRGHRGGATTGDPVHFESHDGGDARAHPWHGYDVDCPDDQRR